MKSLEFSPETAENDDDSLGFADGKLYASAYSYHIDSTGSVELSAEQTRKLYEFMKKYYAEKGII
jgi:hypothetical protein